MCFAYKPAPPAAAGKIFQVEQTSFLKFLHEGKVQPSPDGFHYAKATVGATRITRAGGTFTIEEALSEKWPEHFKLAGVEWFRPILEEIQHGAAIPIQEICQKYKQIYGCEQHTVESVIYPDIDLL